MKKIKLLTSLGAISALGVGVALSTSCSSTDGETKTLIITAQEGAWDKAPQVGVTSTLDITKLTFNPYINWFSTPINADTVKYSDDTEKDFKPSYTEGDPWPVITITPTKSGDSVAYGFQFTCYKDSTMKENGITYKVDGSIKVLPKEEKSTIKAVADTNCKLSENDVSITDITSAATITLSIEGKPSATFEIKEEGTGCSISGNTLTFLKIH